MISFIIIGKNESKNIKNCLNSVYILVKKSSIKNYEIIYVDSNSDDNSLELVLKFPEVKVYKITSGESAASARNTGAERAKYNLLFFIDGDMEVFPVFIDNVYQNNKMLYPFITGHFIYDYQNKKRINYYKKPYVITTVPLGNGTFIIEKEKWQQVGGMDERFKKAQDFDFIFSAAKKGILLKRLQEVIAKHNTVDYNHPRRLWKMLPDQLYVRGLLYRKHFFNKYLWPQLLRREYSLITLLFCFLAFALFGVPYVFTIYFLAIIAKSLVQKHRPWYEFFLRLPYYPFRDIITITGFLFFYPRKSKEVKCERIK